MRKHKVSNLIKSFLLIVGSIFIAMLLTEIGLRIFYPIEFKKPIPRATGNIWRNLLHRESSIPGLSYELVPNAKGKAVYTDIELNSFGMRDKKRDLIKKDSTKRIAIIGDSFTFGFSVPGDKVFPSVLEELLNDSSLNLNYNFEVLNFGVGGYSCKDEALVIKHKVPAWNPDLIIICYVMNDAQMEPNQPLHRYFQKTYWWQYSHLGRLIAKSVKEIKDRNLGKKNYYERLYDEDTRNWQGVVKAFKDINKTAQEENYNIILMVFCDIPNSDHWNNYDMKRMLQKQVLLEAKKNDFYTIDLYKDLCKYNPKELRISEKDGHPTEKGHFLTAEVIKDKLLNEYFFLIFPDDSSKFN